MTDGESLEDGSHDEGSPDEESLDEDIPLDITGHEDRDPPSAESTPGLLAEGDDTEESDDAETVAEAAVEQPDDPTATVTRDASTEDDEVEPVEVLVQLAEEGEIDPWDIDIVAVTDKFLDRLDEVDLRTSGRALFYVSVLLRMKGEAMLSDGEEEEPEPDPWEQALEGPEEGEPMVMDPFDSLEQEMDRRLERKRARGMPETLDELVRDLREAERETWWKKSREYDTRDEGYGSTRGTQELDYHTTDEFRMDDEPTAGDVTEKTHGEDIEETIADVQAALREQYDKGRVEVLFKEISDAGGTRVETFLAILFLSHRNEVRLRQDELFADLWIQDPGAVAGSDEAVAD